MLASSSNLMVYHQQQLCTITKPASPVLAYHLNFTRPIMHTNREYRLPVRLENGFPKKRAYPVADYEGLWEDPDDVSDDSEYDEEEDDDDDVDYDSDWEANGNDKGVVSKVKGLSTRNYEEDLVKEVEEMLKPEEKAILEQNQAPNLDKLSNAKWKALHTLGPGGLIKYMDGLIEKGYNIDQVDKGGLTALHLAVIGKRVTVINHLLRKGSNPEAKDQDYGDFSCVLITQDGATPLHYAAQVGALKIVKILIKYKVDVNIADNEGWTPLHVAMQTRNRDIVKVLLVNGADTTRRNENGNTPLDLSLCYGKGFKSYELAKLVKQVSTSRGL